MGWQKLDNPCPQAYGTKGREKGGKSIGKQSKSSSWGFFGEGMSLIKASQDGSGLNPPHPEHRVLFPFLPQKLRPVAFPSPKRLISEPSPSFYKWIIGKVDSLPVNNEMQTIGFPVIFALMLGGKSGGISWFLADQRFCMQYCTSDKLVGKNNKFRSKEKGDDSLNCLDRYRILPFLLAVNTMLCFPIFPHKKNSLGWGSWKWMIGQWTCIVQKPEFSH